MTEWRCWCCQHLLAVVEAETIAISHHQRVIRIALPAHVRQECDRCGTVNEWQAGRTSFEVEVERVS